MKATSGTDIFPKPINKQITTTKRSHFFLNLGGKKYKPINGGSITYFVLTLLDIGDIEVFFF